MLKNILDTIDIMPIASTLILAALLFVVPAGRLPAQTTPDSLPLRVAYDDNYPPYSFKSASGENQGIIPDQWKEWSSATGRPVTLLPMKWDDCITVMEAGGADVLDSVFETAERKKTYDFLPPYAVIKVPVFIHESISGISDPKDLRGFRVAVKAGDASITELRKSGIDDLVEYPDYEAIVKAAADSAVKIFCIDKPPAQYYLYKYKLDRSFRSAIDLYTGEFHRAVRKDRKPLPDGSDLYAVLKAGFDSIPAAKYRDIERRWFGSAIDSHLDPAVIMAVGGSVAFLVCILAAFTLILRKQVAGKTRELSEKAADLEASERKNRAFIQTLPDLFIIMDRECRYIECKTANPELLERPESDLLGRTPEEMGFNPGFVALLLSSVRQALDGDEVVVCEYELDVIAGKRHFEARIVKMDKDKALVIVRDITAKTIAERKIKDSLLEKEILLKEVHHRVKNNMQVVSSLIQLQASTLRHEEDRLLLSETQQRIKTMAQIHESLYRSDDLGSIDAASYIGAIVEDLKLAYMDTSGSVRIDLELESAECSMDEAVPLGLIVNEIVSNSFKYALSGRKGAAMTVLFRKNADGKQLLAIGDNGPGLPEDWEAKANSTLGLTLVKLLAAQLKGELTITRTNGTRMELVF